MSEWMRGMNCRVGTPTRSAIGCLSPNGFVIGYRIDGPSDHLERNNGDVAVETNQCW